MQTNVLNSAMFKNILFIFCLSYSLKSQTKIDSIAFQQLRNVDFVFISSDSDFQGFIKDFNTVEKGVFVFENGINSILSSTFKYGINKNLELNTGLIYSDGVGEILLGQVIGLKFNHKIGKNVLIGADFNTTFPQYRHSLSFGGQFQNDRILIGGSLFMKLGKHRSFGVTSMNSNNLFANIRLTKRKSISVAQIFANNPNYEFPITLWPIYLANTSFLTLKFIKKKSIIDFGFSFRKSPFPCSNEICFNYEFLPIFKYNRILK